MLVDAKKDFAKGSTAVFGNFEVKVNSVQRDYVPTDGYSVPTDGSEFTVVNVSVKNTSKESKQFSAYDLTLNVNGVAVSSNYMTVAPEFTGGSISPDATATGNIVYEITKGATNLKLQHDETVVDLKGSGVKTLTFTLAI